MLIQVFGPSGVGKSTLLDAIDNHSELSGFVSAAFLKDRLSMLSKSTSSDERKLLVIERFGQEFLDKCFSLIWSGDASAPQKQFSAVMLYRSLETEALIGKYLSDYVVLSDELTLHRSINVLLFCKEIERDAEWFFMHAPVPDFAVSISASAETIHDRVIRRSEQFSRNTYFDFSRYSIQQIIERQLNICSIGADVLSKRTKCIGLTVEQGPADNLISFVSALDAVVGKRESHKDERAYLLSTIENCSRKIKILTSENASLKTANLQLTDEHRSLEKNHAQLESKLSTIVKNYLESDQRVLERRLVDGANELSMMSARLVDLHVAKQSLTESLALREKECISLRELLDQSVSLREQREKECISLRELLDQSVSSREQREKECISLRELLDQSVSLHGKQCESLQFKLNQAIVECEKYQKDCAQLSAKLESVKRERDGMKDRYQEASVQCKKLVGDIKRIKARLLYKLMTVVVKNVRNPIGWVKLPFLLVAEIYSHRKIRLQKAVTGAPSSGNQKQGQVAKIGGAGPDRVTAEEKASLRSEVKVRSQMSPNGVQLSANASDNVNKTGQTLKAVAADEKARLLQCAENLTIANALSNDDRKWLHHVNKYLCQFDICGIRLRPGNEPRFFRIYAESNRSAVDGPVISVIMPAFNAEKTLDLAAQSILNQTWRNIELIIVDDKSSDSTWRIAQNIAARDPRVKVLRNEVNVGPYVSKNRALSVVSGEYFTGHDADDWAHPERLQKHLESMLARTTETHASIAFMIRMTECGIFESSGTSGFLPVASRKLKSTQQRDGFLRVAFISAIFKTDAFRRVLGAWDSVRFGADSELVARASIAFGDRFQEFRQLGMICLSSEGSLTGHPVHGVSPVHGISPSRRYYRDAWSEWHETLSSNNATLEFPLTKRLFDAPEAAIVPTDEVLALLGQKMDQH